MFWFTEQRIENAVHEVNSKVVVVLMNDGARHPRNRTGKRK